MIISDPEDNLWEAVLLVWLVTYGFAGLTLAEIEMHVSRVLPNQMQLKEIENQ